VLHVRKGQTKILHNSGTNFAARSNDVHILTLLVWYREKHPTCKKITHCDAGMVISLERGANDLHTVQLMPLPPHHFLLH